MIQKTYRHVARAFFCSLTGLKAVYQNELAFRLECVLSFLVIPLAFYFAKTGVELAVLLGSWGCVLIAECINSAIEATVDRVGLEIHPLSARAKDIGSAIVFFTSVNGVIMWLCILFKYTIHR